ncbi:putative germin-like protein 9-2 [Pistacia vera]|uniref:putative germin-like protein 9-2 n=1 Tax=Pistacia vera TaxID=55513 RepID=UPI00126333F8|nr:putative germin-like protein 9-2 [Pistacia vera]
MVIARFWDADITTDFVVPMNYSANKAVDRNFYFDLCNMGNSDYTQTFSTTEASTTNFPALDGQSVSYAFLQFPAGAINPPHTHPRSAKLLLVLKGWLNVGFIDTNNKIYKQTLTAGDMFVFPKGLVHYQSNDDPKQPSTAISAFGSANAGTVSVLLNLFTSGIDDNILARVSKIDVANILKLKIGLTPKA